MTKKVKQAVEPAPQEDAPNPYESFIIDVILSVEGVVKSDEADAATAVKHIVIDWGLKLKGFIEAKEKAFYSRGFTAGRVIRDNQIEQAVIQALEEMKSTKS